MNCCTTPASEEISVELMAQIIMLLKDSNPATNWNSMEKAAVLTLSLWSKRQTLDHAGQQYLSQLTQDVMKQRDRLQARKEQKKQWSNRKLLSDGAASLSLPDVKEEGGEPPEAWASVDALVLEVQRRKRFLENRLRKGKRNHHTV